MSAEAQTTYRARVLPLPSGYEVFPVRIHPEGWYGLGIYRGRCVVNLYNPSTYEIRPALYTGSGWFFFSSSCFDAIFGTNMWGDNSLTCGFGMSPHCGCNDYSPHALLLHPHTVDLHPCGVGACDGEITAYVYSAALRVRGNLQVGYAHKDICTKYRAMLWFSSAASYIDLHPSDDYEESKALGLSQDGRIQVGYIRDVVPFQAEYIKATLWYSSPTNFRFLPPDSLKSIAFNAWNRDIVGCIAIELPDTYHAILWKDDGMNFIDLHPSHMGFSSSVALSVANNTQVGYAVTPEGAYKAIRWLGTPTSAMDLNNFLPSQYRLWNAVAVEIDPQGNIIGYIWTGNIYKVVIWTPLATIPIAE